MTAYVFISYSKEHDLAYVEELAAFLDSQGIPVWFDREIIGGSRWAEVIAEKIDTCGAVIAVMSPGSEKSKWVSREIGRAEEKDKTIVPVLRGGQPFFRISDIQYVDATKGQMPGAAVLDQLRELLASAGGQVLSATDPIPHADASVPSTPGPTPDPAAPEPQPRATLPYQDAHAAPGAVVTAPRRRRAPWIALAVTVLVGGLVVAFQTILPRLQPNHPLANDARTESATSISPGSGPSPSSSPSLTSSPSPSSRPSLVPASTPTVDPAALAVRDLFRNEGFGMFADRWLPDIHSCNKDETVLSLGLGILSEIRCSLSAPYSTPGFVAISFSRYQTPADASRYMGCSKPQGAPGDLNPTKVDLPGSSGPRSGYYCEYYVNGGSDSAYSNVTISWTGTDGTGGFQGQLQYNTDNSHTSEALHEIRELWARYA